MKMPVCDTWLLFSRYTKPRLSECSVPVQCLAGTINQLCIQKLSKDLAMGSSLTYNATSQQDTYPAKEHLPATGTIMSSPFSH